MSQNERGAFKNWFDREAAEILGGMVKRGWKGFDVEVFVKRATRGLGKLEMQSRVKQFAVALREGLPEERALGILKKSLPVELESCEEVNQNYVLWPMGQYVADYGLDDYAGSMELMVELTKRHTSEFAVRPFVEKVPERVFADLLELTQDDNPHVRRWCSEGVRTRLPWGKKLHEVITDPSGVWPILEALKDDEELYVRKSVANNLNDLAKDWPDEVVEVCRRWKKDGNARRDWVVKHALRSLLKEGHQGALEVMGYGEPKELDVSLNLKPKKVVVGEGVTMEVEMRSGFSRKQKLLVDYVVHYVRKAGKTGEKVFKWKVLELGAGEVVTLKKKHAMRVTTVRALYPGKHRVGVQVNGRVVAEAGFVLEG